ncbi:MAG: AAA family ATPase [Alphaproteobacteria bacterium]|nr:AAA family ATPase [Alphaproteobacteria bacterium]
MTEAALPVQASEPDFMRTLNAAQRDAVLAQDGPVLVLAGAGTGKTRVLTARLAWLLYTGRAVPGQIMAVTFTNKAAREVRERVSAMLGRSTEGWYLGTFHALAARLLRPHAERVGLRPDFTILDTDDQLRLIKQLLQAENIDEKKSPARMVLSVIERWKDRGLPPERVNEKPGEMANGKILKIYHLYQERLRTLNACDFGDLMMHQLTLLQENPDILLGYHNRFRYLLVDEYQDTNVAQYLWLRLLAQGHNNICVVGDEDQSIYGWRGAEIGNILRFEEDFPGAKVVRLEENYRSTGHILGAAAGLITHNRARLGKTLWTAAEQGDKVLVRGLWDGEEEARWVAEEIETLQRRRVALADMAVMVRAGFQTRSFEERFMTLGIPYRVLVGARFYERAEIRDAMAYMRLINSPADDLAFERIINVPKRGIGPAAMQQLHMASREARIPLAEAALRLCETDELKPKLRASLRELLAGFARWRGLLETLPHTEVAQIALDESGYTAMWQADKSPEAPGRLENLKELVSAMAEFDTLPAFLEHVSLVLEQTEQAGADQVSIMTLHGAKGLEFDHVFLPGWEEEIFPSRRTLEENGNAGLEEERRLAYVGITRARQRACISFVASRNMFGSWINAIPSRFIAELPSDHVQMHALAGRAAFGGGENYGRRERAAPLWQQMQKQMGGKPARLSRPPVRAPRDIIDVDYDVVQEDADFAFQPGARVFHEKFGHGTIKRYDHGKLEIAFDKAGVKKVLAEFVRGAS